MEIKDRIKEIIEYEKIPPRVFAETIGVQQSTLSHILNNRNKPSLEVIMKIHQYYTYVNLEWLIYGKGEMLTSPTQETTPKDNGGDDFVNLENGINEPIGEGHFSAPSYSDETNIKVGNTSLQPEIRYIEKPERKITEIRVFFDDNTFEIFKPEKS